MFRTSPAWLILFCGFLLSFGLSASEILGRVVAVSDGDSITVLASDNRQVKVRLAGIDAPERSQSFGQSSRRNLSDLVFGKEVRVSVVDTDRYGRIVGIVYVPVPGPNDEIVIDVDLAQIESGHAWAYRSYLRTLPSETAKRYTAAEDNAKARRQGLWIEKEPNPPWEWRREKREKK
jgi:endonuclease YncB( thermonuclease family)